MKKADRRWFFLLPAIAIMLGLGLFPFLYNVFLSLERWGGSGAAKFIGLHNYLQVLKDTNLPTVLKTTGIYVVSALGAELVLGTLIAFFLEDKFWGRDFLRTVLLLPMIMAPVVAGLIWRWILTQNLGLANALLGYVGIPHVPWLSRPGWSLFSVIMIDVWQWTPFVVLIVLSGLESIPLEVKEASIVDGANFLQRRLLISLPLVTPVLWIAGIFRFLDVVRYVDVIFITTYGGPGTATTVFGFYTYLRAFTLWQLGYAAALSLLQLIAILVVANVLFNRAGVFRGVSQ